MLLPLRRPTRPLTRSVPLLLAAGLLALTHLAPPATAHDLGPLGAGLDVAASPGWVVTDQGDVVVLENDGGAQDAQILLYPAGPAPLPLRSSLLTFSMESDNPQSTLAFVLTNSQAAESCFLWVEASGTVELECVSGTERTTLTRHPGAARLDGSDRLQVIEQDGIAAFFLNDTEVGRIQGSAAQGVDMGVLALGRGTFYLGHFSVVVPDEEAPQQTPPAKEAPTETLASLEAAFAGARPRPGWSLGQSATGWTMENPSRPGDEWLIPFDLPPVGDQTRIVAVDVSLSPPPASGAEGWSARAAGGLFWQNPQTGQACTLHITAAGDGVMACFTSAGRAIEVGRLPGVANGPGPHTVAVIENGNDLVGMIGREQVGHLQGHPSQGGDFALYAYERGSFGFAELAVESIRRDAPPPPTETRSPDISMGDGLEGPLPLFGGDPDKAAAAYLGITRSIFLHELGHALIGELAVPSTGPEEDAVDIYSALQMADAMILPNPDPLLDRTAPMAASYAALAWYYSGRMSEGQAQPEGQWQDEHTADLKRFRNMFCVIYGANPTGFGALAAGVQMEERTLARCEDEFRKQNRAWRAILSPYTRISADTPEGLLPANAPGAAVEVELKPSRRQIGEYMRQTYGTVLRDAALQVGESFALPRPLKVIYQDCDTINAWYAPNEGSITMCYDIIEHFAVMISDIEEGTRDGYAAGGMAVASAPPQGTAASAPPSAQAFDELADAGVPATLRLFPAPYRGATPNSHAKAEVVTTADVQTLIAGQTGAMVLDVRENGATDGLPGAVSVPGLGGDGSLRDGLQGRVEQFLSDFTQGQPDMALIVTGDGPEDRASYNAALRIASAGYRALWYRGGNAAWVANGLPLAPLE